MHLVYSLNDEVVNKVKQYTKKFQDWIKTEEQQKDLEYRNKKQAEFKSILRKENINNITEFEFNQIISSLWAYAGWGNKEYVANRIIENIGIDELKKQLYNLLYGSEPFQKRYDDFMKKVKYLGPAGITEILTLTDSQRYSIWNDRSRKALKILGLEKELNANKYKISGAEYERVNDAVKSISSLIHPNNNESDLMLTDFFLYFVQSEPSVQSELEIVDLDFDHDEMIDKLEEFGRGLGFETEREKSVAPGAKIDMIWKARIANLGALSYVFEVQKSGSIDSLILNLQKARSNPSVQKCIVVANKRMLERIQNEVNSLPEEFRKSLAWFDVSDIERALDQLKEVNQILTRLELVKPG